MDDLILFGSLAYMAFIQVQQFERVSSVLPFFFFFSVFIDKMQTNVR